MAWVRDIWGCEVPVVLGCCCAVEVGTHIALRSFACYASGFRDLAGARVGMLLNAKGRQLLLKLLHTVYGPYLACIASPELPIQSINGAA